MLNIANGYSDSPCGAKLWHLIFGTFLFSNTVTFDVICVTNDKKVTLKAKQCDSNNLVYSTTNIYTFSTGHKNEHLLSAKFTESYQY